MDNEVTDFLRYCQLERRLADLEVLVLGGKAFAKALQRLSTSIGESKSSDSTMNKAGRI